MKRLGHDPWSRAVSLFGSFGHVWSTPPSDSPALPFPNHPKVSSSSWLNSEEETEVVGLVRAAGGGKGWLGRSGLPLTATSPEGEWLAPLETELFRSAGVLAERAEAGETSAVPFPVVEEEEEEDDDWGAKPSAEATPPRVMMTS